MIQILWPRSDLSSRIASQPRASPFTLHSVQKLPIINLSDKLVKLRKPPVELRLV